MSARTVALGVALLTGAATLALSAAPALAGPAHAGLRSAGSVTTSPAQATPAGCTDSWTNTAGGSWDTASNWSAGVPTSTSNVCIAAAGSYTVLLGNETLTIASLTVGGSGSTPTLAIGNGGSSFPHITVSGAVTVNATLSDGWGGTFTAGSITVGANGTFLIPATNYTSTVTAPIDVFGAMTVNDTLGLSLPASSSTLTIEASGSLTVASGKILAVTSPSGQTGTVVQKGLITNNGSFTVADALQIAGGTICGNSPLVGAGDAGAGGTLAFAGTVTAGPACSGSAPTDQIFVPNVTATVSGTIPAAYTVSIGDGGSGFPTVTLSGVTNAGTLSFGWGGTLTGSLTNTGTFTIPATSYTSTFNAPSVDNSGTITVNGNLALSLTTSSSTFTNEAAGSLTVASGKSLAVSSPSGQTATVVQKGLITNNGALTVTDTLDVNGGSICGNAVYSGSGDGGTGATLAFPVKLSSGPGCGALPANKLFVPNVTGTITGDIPKGYTVTVGDGGSSYAHVTWTGTTVTGTLAPGFGATLTAAATVSVKGTLTVPASPYNTVLDFGGLANAKTVSLLGTTTLNLTGTTLTNAKGAKWTVGKTVPVTTTATLANAGTLTLAPGATLAVGGFSQTSTGTLAVQFGSSSGTVRIQDSGTATLAGKITTKSVKYKPAHGQSFTVLSASSVSGTFATASGPYTITYPGASVVATFA